MFLNFLFTMGLGKLTEIIFQNTTWRRLTLLGIGGLSLLVINASARNPEEPEERSEIELIIPQETYKVIFPFEEPTSKIEEMLLERLGEVEYMNLVRKKTDAQMAFALSNAISNLNPNTFQSLFNILIEQRNLTEYIALEDIEKYNITKHSYQGTIDPTRPLPQPVFYQRGRFGNLINLSNNENTLDEGWIHQQGDTSTVNIGKIVGGYGSYNHTYQSLVLIPLSVDRQDAFDYSCYYDGWLYYGRKLNIKYTEHIEVTRNLIPNDGILQGIIVERFEDGKPFAYIFLDEDWRKEFGDDIHIAWGDDFQNFRLFKFNQIAQGVYMDKVEDTIERVDAGEFIPPNVTIPRPGGIIVGNIQHKAIKDDNFYGQTFIGLR